MGTRQSNTGLLAWSRLREYAWQCREGSDYLRVLKINTVSDALP